MNHFNSLEEEDEYWEHRMAEHPFSRMMNAMDEIQTFGYRGDMLRRAERKKAGIFWQYWDESAREWMKEQGQHSTRALEDIGDEVVNAVDINNTLIETDILLLNAGMYEERMRICEDLLNFFNWKDDPSGEAVFRAYIGESLEKLGKREECDNYFQALLREQPENVEYINMYLNCLCDRKAYEEARQLLEKHLTQDTDVTERNNILFWRAEEIYEGLGNSPQASFYQAKRENWERNRPATVSPLNRATAKLMSENPDLMKDIGLQLDLDATATKLPVWKMQGGKIAGYGGKKIYPNDPCPCGSGKKYKRCCGKKT